jgi:hypothetical protein
MGRFDTASFTACFIQAATHTSTQTFFCFLSRKLQTLAVQYCRRIPLARFSSTAAIQQRNRCVRILCSERACAVALHQPRHVEAAAADIPVIQNTIRESRCAAPILQPLNDFQRPCTQDRGAAHHTRWVDARLLPAASAAHMGGSGTGRHWHLQAEQQRAQGDGRLAPSGRDYDGAGGRVRDALQLLHARGDELSLNLRRG